MWAHALLPHAGAAPLPGHCSAHPTSWPSPGAFLCWCSSLLLSIDAAAAAVAAEPAFFPMAQLTPQLTASCCCCCCAPLWRRRRCGRRSPPRTCGRGSSLGWPGWRSVRRGGRGRGGWLAGCACGCCWAMAAGRLCCAEGDQGVPASSQIGIILCFLHYGLPSSHPRFCPLPSPPRLQSPTSRAAPRRCAR